MSSSIRMIRSMLPLFFGMSLLFVGNGLVISSCGVKLKEMGVGELEIGAINTCFFIGALISTIGAHRIVSKVGHIRSFAIFSAVFGVAAMFHGFSQNLYFWALLRALLGFCYYGLLMVIESWLNAKTATFIRSRVIAFYEGVFYFSFSAGILILLFKLDTFEIFIISAAFIMLSSIPLNLIRIKEPKIPKKESVSIPKIFSIVPLALVGSVIAGVLINGFFSMASLFVMLQGQGAKEVSIFMTTAMVGGFFAQISIGSLSDKFGRRPAIMGCAIISLISAVLFLVTTGSSLTQYILSFFLGSGFFCLYGLSLARANDMLVDRTHSIEVGRALLFSYCTGSLISPLLMGASMKFFGAMGFIYVYILLLTILIAFAMTQKTVPMHLRKPYEEHPMHNMGEMSALNSSKS
ncbi:MFS transporter [Campylobacter sp. RM9344]|uniref:MFS transporter n=1 Tax=Campylobacter californiensis TaxID=1032243 RepID=A0AAW3ZY00_9BACT|nr:MULTISPECIES: MFS transporter [unclassified Campylobacter]MBE2984827.1 MFS transporter [Campylobacter sp. RM6883]MBE2994707.1 MFS transporter [Campylobacter sp. RM6913]MBE3029573.1 MFS transporter [Campylobacter sp. RM9344]MBE3608351.1 MFS transporter [Campylobacter sp. RM9337]QCD50516.1 major facilitator superfamily transporter, possible sugar permease [Campylobacter sp. RM6914]